MPHDTPIRGAAREPEVSQQTTQPMRRSFREALASFRVQNPVEVKAAEESRIAATLQQFDSLDAYMADILRRWNADMRPAELRTRLGDAS